MDNKSKMKRAERVLVYLVISIFLGGGCVALASMEPNPFNWNGTLRGLGLLIVFLFFQWLYTEDGEECETRFPYWKGKSKEKKKK